MDESKYFSRQAEMSDVVKCRFYYGDGTVLTNEFGADLSQFQQSELKFNSPHTWSISQIKEWLVRCLGLSPETDTVGVHALWTKSMSMVDVFFYLRPIDRTFSGCAGYKPVKAGALTQPPYCFLWRRR